MGIVNETVQDGVGIGRIADYFVPSVYWKLGGNHRGAASVAFLEDFQEIMSGGVNPWRRCLGAGVLGYELAAML